MIKHVYLYRLKDKAQASEIAQKLLSLKNIPEVKDVEVGIDFVSTAKSFDLAEIVSFRNRIDFEAFCKNDYHNDIRSYMADKYTEGYKVDFITGEEQ